MRHSKLMINSPWPTLAIHCRNSWCKGNVQITAQLVRYKKTPPSHPTREKLTLCCAWEMVGRRGTCSLLKPIHLTWRRYKQSLLLRFKTKLLLTLDPPPPHPPLWHKSCRVWVPARWSSECISSWNTCVHELESLNTTCGHLRLEPVQIHL